MPAGIGVQKRAASVVAKPRDGTARGLLDRAER
jgi:hypothetical protein